MSLTSPEVVPVWTVQTRFISADHDPSATPYNRIVAVATSPDTVVECADIASRRRRPASTQQRMLRLPDAAIAGQFMEYFATIVAPNDVRLKIRNPVTWDYRPETNYNCHDAVDAWLGDAPPSGWKAAWDRAQERLPDYRALPNSDVLPGLHGMIAKFDNKEAAAHSFLTLEGGVCLSVMALGATVGTTNVRDMLKDHETLLECPVRAVFLDPNRVQNISALGQGAVTASLARP